MHEQDKQECTEKTAAKQAIQGSGRVRGGTMLWDDGEGESLGRVVIYMDCLLKRRQGCSYRRHARQSGIILGFTTL